MLLAEVWRWGADEATVRALLPAADAALDVDRAATATGTATASWSTSAPPTAGWSTRAGRTASTGSTTPDGRLGVPPLALVEVQGYAYAAWLARAELAAGVRRPGHRRPLPPAGGDSCGSGSTSGSGCRTGAGTRWRWTADKRPLDALTSNPGHCLWTGIVDDERAERLIAHLGGSEMDSGFGLRTLAVSMGAYNPMSYHNGSVWPHDTALCVAGLMRYAHVPGAVELAHRLADGLLDAAEAFGGRLPELYCGFPRERHAPPVPYPTSCSPQAWASAAPLLLMRALLGLDPDVPGARLRAASPAAGRLGIGAAGRAAPRPGPATGDRLRRHR